MPGHRAGHDEPTSVPVAPAFPSRPTRTGHAPNSPELGFPWAEKRFMVPP